MMKQFGLLTVLFALVGCASVHPGTEGHAVSDRKLPLKLSAATVGDAVEESFQAIEVTIENEGPQWLKISSAKVVIEGDASKELSLVVGEDLRDWASAIANRERIEAHNKGVLMASLITAGAVATAVSGDKPVQAAGSLATATGYGMFIDASLDQMMRSAEGVAAVPSNYITAPVSIPGKLFQRRWLLMNKPVGKLVRTLVLEFETADGTKDVYVVAL